MKDYFGTYHRFETVSKKDASQLLYADNLVGDVYSIADEIDDGEHRAWLVSRFGKKVGYFDAEFSRNLSVMKAQGMECKAILSYVAFTEDEGEGVYWGEMAVICYGVSYAETFERFVTGVSQKIASGVRPVLNLDGDAVQKIIDSNGEWIPKQTMPSLEKIKGTAIMKQRQGLLDKTIEQGRAGNKGCFIVSWVFLLAVVAAVVYLIWSLF